MFRIRIEHGFEHILNLLINEYVAVVLSYLLTITSVVIKSSNSFTILSCFSKILEKDLSFTANRPFFVSYLPLISILVGLFNHKGRPWINSTTMHPSPQTSMAEIF